MRLIYCQSAAIYENVGNFKVANNLYKSAYNVAIQQPKTDSMQAEILLRLANTSREQAFWNQALNYYNTACNLYEKLEDYNGLVQGILETGIMFEKAGYFEEALNHYSRALELSEDLDNDILKGESLLLLASASRKIHRHDIALQNLKQAREIFKGCQHAEKLTRCLLSIGKVYFAMKEYDKVLSYYDEGLLIAVQTDDRLMEGTFLMEIGNILRDQKKYDQALRVYAEAVQIENVLNNPLRLAILTMNMGIVYHTKNQLEAAYICYSRAQSKFKERANQSDIAFHLAECQFHLGKIYILRNAPQAAVECYQDVLRIWNAKQRPLYVAIAMFNLGNAYMQLGDRKNAQTFLEKALESFIDLGSPYAKVAKQALDQFH